MEDFYRNLYMCTREEQRENLANIEDLVDHQIKVDKVFGYILENYTKALLAMKESSDNEVVKMALELHDKDKRCFVVTKIH